MHGRPSGYEWLYSDVVQATTDPGVNNQGGIDIPIEDEYVVTILPVEDFVDVDPFTVYMLAFGGGQAAQRIQTPNTQAALGARISRGFVPATGIAIPGRGKATLFLAGQGDADNVRVQSYHVQVTPGRVQRVPVPFFTEPPEGDNADIELPPFTRFVYSSIQGAGAYLAFIDAYAGTVEGGQIAVATTGAPFEVPVPLSCNAVRLGGGAGASNTPLIALCYM